MITLMPMKAATAATRLSRASFHTRICDGLRRTFFKDVRVNERD